MNKKILSITVIIFTLIFGTVGAMATSIQEPLSSTSDTRMAQVVLSKKIKVEEVPQLIKALNVKIVGFNNISVVEDREYSGFYLVNGNVSLEDAIEDYKNQYAAMLKDAIIALNKRISETQNDQEKESVIRLLEDTIKRKELFEKDKKIDIYAFVTYGDIEDIIELKEGGNDKIAKVNLKPVQKLKK